MAEPSWGTPGWHGLEGWKPGRAVGGGRTCVLREARPGQDRAMRHWGAALASEWRRLAQECSWGPRLGPQKGGPASWGWRDG